MALINPDDLKFRSDQIARLSSIDIDTNILTLQQTSLASSNSLIYKSASYSIISNTPLPNPSQGYFNSRTIESNIYYPFQDGSSFVFKFSDTDYGYYASASSTSRWWSVLSSVETAYEKRLIISEIGASYNYWEFKMDSLSFTNSTWIFSGQKLLGPTYSNFEPEKHFTIGYSLSGGMTAGGSTTSIAGQIVDGYTTLNYPLLSETLYLGDLTYTLPIGVTGSSVSGTNSIVTVGGQGILVNRLYFGGVNSGQSLLVSGGNLYVNGLTFSGGTSSGASGPQGPTGANGSDGPNSIRLIFGNTSGSFPTTSGSFNTSGGPSFSDVTTISFNTPFTDLNGSDITDWLDNLISDRLANKTINAQISEVGVPSNYGIYTTIPNTPSPNASWSLTFVTGNGTFSANRIYTISVVSGGPRGATGPQGPRGATGADGTLTFQGAWATSSLYGIEEYVTYGGSTWFTTGGASDGVSPSPTNSNWTLFAGAALIVGTAIPNNSSSVGSKGEIRVNNGEYLYIHTGAQWLKSSMTFSTF